MHLIKYISILLFIGISLTSKSQNLHYFFIDDIYQRSYFNPALNNKDNFKLATGLDFDFTTNGPSISDLTSKNPSGGLIISAANAIGEINEFNDIYGYTSVNTFDASIKIPFCRISIGHAWKAQGWMEYTRDLAEFVTSGNGAFVGQTLNLAPQLDYINYNEVYLGLQKSFGTFSFGVRVKRLSGVESIRTGNHKIDLTTSDDIYQLTLDTDFELSSSRAFNYTDIENFDLNVENFSFDNFMKNNGGWAFDVGASLNLGDRLELSLGIVDIGGMDWDFEPKTYRSNQIQTFDGIDVSEYITSDDEIVILDSLESLLDLTETNEVFNTKLPSKIYLGGKLKISNLWTVGALVQSNGSGDRRVNIVAFNGTARLYKFLSVGVLYSIKNGNPTNLGLHTTFKVGAVTGFLSTDNMLKLGSLKSTNSNIRAGLSIGI
jgi:hypothetical protein